MSAKTTCLIRHSPPAKKWPKKAPGLAKRKRKTPDQLWKCTPRNLARVTAGSAWANDHITTPGINDDLPIWGTVADYTRWTAFEFLTADDMRKAGAHLIKTLTLSKFPFLMQQRSLIVPKAAGKIIAELYRSKRRFMSGIPLYIGKCALYQSSNLSAADRSSPEFSKALAGMYYATWIPWEGRSSDEACQESKYFVYATRFDKVKRALTKKANAENEARIAAEAAAKAMEAAAKEKEDAPFDLEKPPI